MKKALFALAVIGCASTNSATQTAGAPRGTAVYDGSFSVDPAAQRLTAKWHIVFAADSTSRDSVHLLLNPGLTVAALTGSRVRDFVAKDTAGFNRITLFLKPGIKTGDLVEFDISYSGQLRFGSDGINSIGPRWIELGLDSFWHPVFAGFDKSITSTFRVLAPSGWDVVASGEMRDGRMTNNTPLIDVAFVATPEISATTSAGATVYHLNEDTSVVRGILTTASACANHLNERYGARGKLPHAKLVLAPREGPGYARKNYIVLTDVKKLPAEARGRFICHELAHFWSSGAISSGPENWLNEGFAEFISARFVRVAHGETAYQTIVRDWSEAAKEHPPVWTPQLTRRPGPRVAYRKAPYILHQLEQRIGTTQMDEMLEAYMVNRIATTPELLSMVAKVAGPETGEWLRMELAK